MANNTTLNTMTGGDVIADEDVAGVKYQLIKLVDGTAAGTGRIAGDATNGLDVDVTRIIPGTGATNQGKAEDAAHTSGDVGVMALGVANEAGVALAGTDLDYTPHSTDLRGRSDVLVRQPQFWYEVDVPGVAATSHTLGDQYGTLITVANAARYTGGGGFITGISLFDDSDAMGAFDVVFFNDTPTLAADDAAYAVSDAHNRFTLALANITYASDMGANRVGQLTGVSIPYFCTATSLYVALITRTTFTAVASAVRFRVSLLRD